MKLTDKKLAQLKKMAAQIRIHIIEMTTNAASGHPGGSLSCTDILTHLYFHKMRIRPDNPDWPDRDRFILSKGHACPAWYAILAERGYFPLDELKTLRRLGSILQGHPSCGHTPGVDVSSGSLGQGLSVANGMALAGRIDNKDYRVYALLGDGETDEGQIWEAAMAATHYKLDNVCAIVDKNGLQLDGRIEDIMNYNPFLEKWEAFGWNALAVNGHDFEELNDAFCRAEETKGKPTVIIAETVKGKGVSFMEHVVDYHGQTATPEQAEIAYKELSLIE